MRCHAILKTKFEMKMLTAPSCLLKLRGKIFLEIMKPLVVSDPPSFVRPNL